MGLTLAAHPKNMIFRKRPRTSRRPLLWFFLLLACPMAGAQILDRIDVEPRENEARIVVRFTPKILYLRHVPLHEGKELRVFLRLNGSGLVESDLMQEAMRAPRAERVPGMTVLYPELVNGMLVTFSQKTSFAVRPGVDEHSIIITVPLLPPSKPAATPAPTGAGAALPAEALAPRPTGEPSPQAAPAAAPVAPSAPAPEEPGKEEQPLPAAAPPAPAAPPALAPTEVETRARAYMEEARRALAGKDAGTAINRLNRILGLPVSSQTEAAQALIGEAREHNGEILKARAEYELYLKLFPAGPSASRVRDRLAALPKGELAARAAPKALPKEAGPAEWSYNGSVSAYYYTGKSQIETLVPPPPGQLTFNRDTLSMVDQRSLITSINLNARRRDAFSDTRFVLRDTDNSNYLARSRSYNRLYSAYVDHNDRQVGYYVRLGRQNPNGMGVLERFDGLQAGYALSPQWRVNGVYGDAVEFGSPFKKVFYGASADLLPQTGRPGVSAYVIEQTLDGMANRRAVGAEARYFDGRATAYGMLDYDVLYKGINIALLQGNYLDEGGNNYFFVIDHRRAPSFSLTNALVAAPGLSLQDMVSMQSLDLVRSQAIAQTAISNMFAVGVTHPLSERWQVGADYRLSSISSTQPVVAVLPLAVIGTCLGTIDPVNDTCVFNTAAQQGSGNNHVVTLQAIGNSLFVANAVGVANISFIAAPTYSGQSLGLNYMLPIGDQWRVDASLRYYTQKDDGGEGQNRLSSSLRISYQWQNSLYLEGEMGREISNSSGPTRDDHIKRDYVYTGLRWDFR